MSFIIYSQTNGQLAVVSPTNNISIEQLVDTVIPANAPYKIVDTVDIDNDFFNAYDYSENGPVINISRAKEIQKNKFRSARNSLLAKLDVDYMKADEIGNVQNKAEIAAKKQALRDITDISLPDTLEGIKNTWPEILN